MGYVLCPGVLGRRFLHAGQTPCRCPCSKIFAVSSCTSCVIDAISTLRGGWRSRSGAQSAEWCPRTPTLRSRDCTLDRSCKEWGEGRSHRHSIWFWLLSSLQSKGSRDAEFHFSASGPPTATTPTLRHHGREDRFRVVSSVWSQDALGTRTYDVIDEYDMRGCAVSVLRPYLACWCDAAFWPLEIMSAVLALDCPVRLSIPALIVFGSIALQDGVGYLEGSYLSRLLISILRMGGDVVTMKHCRGAARSLQVPVRCVIPFFTN